MHPARPDTLSCACLMTGARTRLFAMPVLFFSLFSLSVSTAAAGMPDIRIAAASNFSGVIDVLAVAFEKETGLRVTVTPGSTGKLFAQIVNNAPFDLFLAADAERPRLLEERGAAVAGTRFTYAIGRLVLWSPVPGLIDDQGRVLRDGSFRYLAMANPDLAPYGAGAKSVLMKLGLWEELKAKVVTGQNIAQAFQFVESGNADLGFVAMSQLAGKGDADGGSRWIPPSAMYDPVEQQAVLLRDRPETRRLLEYLMSDEARAIILDHGYGVPDAE